MMKAALVEFKSAFATSVPNVIIFQFNPETLRHALTQPTPAAQPGQAGGNPLAITGVPGETFSFSLSLDVTDQLSDPDGEVRAHAEEVGLHPRLAALEMLLFPIPVPPGAATQSRATPAAQVPVVLFVWGANRIVPVRVTSLMFTEKLYDTALNPTHADAQIELRVLTPDELAAVTGWAGGIAVSAYSHTLTQRATWATAQVGDAARTTIGLLATIR